MCGAIVRYVYKNKNDNRLGLFPFLLSLLLTIGILWIKSMKIGRIRFRWSSVLIVFVLFPDLFYPFVLPLFFLFKHSFKNASNFKTFSSSSNKSLGLTSRDLGQGGMVPDPDCVSAFSCICACACLLSATNSLRGVRYCIVLLDFILILYLLRLCRLYLESIPHRGRTCQSGQD